MSVRSPTEGPERDPRIRAATPVRPMPVAIRSTPQSWSKDATSAEVRGSSNPISELACMSLRIAVSASNCSTILVISCMTFALGRGWRIRRGDARSFPGLNGERRLSQARMSSHTRRARSGFRWLGSAM